jgi:hypothetical protein
MNKFLRIVILVGLLTNLEFTVTKLQAQITLTTSVTSYSQNFDGLGLTGANITWSNNSTLAGWLLFRQPTPGTAITTYNADNGGSNSGTFYSYGATSVNDRAFGGLASGGTYFGSPGSGAIAGWVAVAFTNNTGAALSSAVIGFDGEQWRDGGL